MATEPRIAVVATRPEDLTRDLSAIAEGATLRIFADLYDEAEAIRRFRPDVLVLRQAVVDDQDAGALRLLRGVLPRTGLVLIIPPDQEERLRPLARQLHARLLPEPFARTQLAAALATARSGADALGRDTLVDLARGLADEVNNPLLFIGGHLQVLRQIVPKEVLEPAAEQLEAIESGLRRIAATIEKIRVLSEAEVITPTTVDLRPLLERAAHVAPRPLPTEGLNDSPIPVLGDEELLETALVRLCEVGGAVVGAGGEAQIEVRRDEQRVRVRLRLRSEALPAWQIPRSFDPFYLNRFLRGTAHGLNLMVVQAIAEAHGGGATARREPGGTIVLEISLPRP